jgi:hypothetical protein
MTAFIGCLRLAPFLTGPRAASLRMTNHESLLTHWTPREWILLRHVKAKVTLRLTVGRSVSKSRCRAPFGDHDQIFITVWKLWSSFCEAPSLTRGRVCLLYMLLYLANAIFLGSESLGTRDHILLSQIWDFPFRCLLRLAGSKSKLHCDWRSVSQSVCFRVEPPLAVQSFSGASPLRLATTFYCLRFETSLFVASYDSQGHGGGIPFSYERITTLL